MIELLFAVVLVAAIVALYVAADRARTIAVCVFERGKVRVVRGRLRAEVVAEIADVAKRMSLGSGEVRVQKQKDVAVIVVKGVSDPRAEQQLRNALGRFPLARMR